MALAPNPTCHSAICARDWLQPSRIIIIANLPREDAALQLSVLLQFSKGCNHLQVSSATSKARASLRPSLCFPSHNTVKALQSHYWLQGCFGIFSFWSLVWGSCSGSRLLSQTSTSERGTEHTLAMGCTKGNTLGNYPQVCGNICALQLAINNVFLSNLMSFSKATLVEYFHNVFCWENAVFWLCISFNVILCLRSLPNFIFFSHIA